MRILLLSLVLLSACSEGTGLQCPASTSTVGQYSLAFTAVHDAGECVAFDGGADAGPPVNLTLNNLPAKGSALCVGKGTDGGPQPLLLVPDKGPNGRQLILAEDGGFQFSNDAGIASGTACVCDVAIVETLNGSLQTSGPFALRPDGGLPPITGITATLRDSISPSAASGCICTLPCTVTYSVTGTLL